MTLNCVSSSIITIEMKGQKHSPIHSQQPDLFVLQLREILGQCGHGTIIKLDGGKFATVDPAARCLGLINIFVTGQWG